MNIAFKDCDFPDLIVPCIQKYEYCESMYFSGMDDVRQILWKNDSVYVF